MDAVVGACVAVVIGVCAFVCVVLFLRRRGRAVVGGEERLCLSVRSLARVQERQDPPVCRICGRSLIVR